MAGFALAELTREIPQGNKQTWFEELAGGSFLRFPFDIFPHILSLSLSLSFSLLNASPPCQRLILDGAKQLNCDTPRAEAGG